MNNEVLQFRKTADVSVDTLRIFLNEKQVIRNFCSLLSAVLECDVHRRAYRYLKNVRMRALIKIYQERNKFIFRL